MRISPAREGAALSWQLPLLLPSLGKPSARDQAQQEQTAHLGPLQEGDWVAAHTFEAKALPMLRSAFHQQHLHTPAIRQSQTRC